MIFVRDIQNRRVIFVHYVLFTNPASGCYAKCVKPMTERSTRDTKSSESGAYAESAAADGSGNGTQEGSETNSRMAPVTAPAV